MTPTTLSAAIAAVFIALAAAPPAAATRSWQPEAEWPNTNFRKTSEPTSTASRRSESRSEPGSAPSSSSGVGPRPSAWCGWYMRTRHGGGPEMNLAWNWSRYGSAASPQVGAIVVWRHHVGEIVGKADNGMWLVHSGNDGGAVRTRARSISGAVVRI